MTMPLLPTLEELLHPNSQPEEIRARALASTDELDPIHLFNMTWRRPEGHIEHVVLPPELTGLKANLIVMSGRRFPTGSHKVGPAYSCLREQVLGGEISAEASTLVFPSTGNFGIGGAWVGPRVGFRSLVVLPEDMSAERFEKIRGYGAEIIATPGCESNVKEIYDKVHELRRDPANCILNQFEAFGNYRFHHHVTGGSAVELVAELGAQGFGDGRAAAFVSAMGSSGTIAVGDRLKDEFPECLTVGVEPIQCPTLFNVGYGGHGIEGIGDKHVTWIHNVRATDAMVCVDDHSCIAGLQLLQEGRHVLAAELGLDREAIDAWDGVFGISGVCNILASIKIGRHYDLQPGQNIVTVATDGFDRYPSVLRRLDATVGPMTDAVARDRIDIFSAPGADWILEGTMAVKRRWHNQKYFTWVEQQGKTVDELEALWEPSFWRALVDAIPALDAQTLALRP